MPGPTLSSPSRDTGRLELRLGGPPTATSPGQADTTRRADGERRYLEAPGPQPDALLDRAHRARVTALDVVLRGPDLAPGAAASVARLVDRLPALRGLSLSWSSQPEPGQVLLAREIGRTCRRRGLTLTAEFTVDAGADAFAAVGRSLGTSSPTSLAAVLDASRALRLEGVPVRWLVPLLPALVHRLEALFSLAEDEGVEAVLAPPPGTAPDHSEHALDGEDRLFVADFAAYRLLDEGARPRSADRDRAYRALAQPLAVSGGQWAGTRGGRMLRQAMGVGGVLVDGVRALAQWTCAALADLPGRRSPAPAPRFPRVLLIGAYGGEHIGDAAILGGVLLRLNERYGTTRAVVMSQRPAHTRHLLPMLDTPFAVEVEAYEHARIRERVAQADGVVFAGGPLIDLPKQLVRHLYTVSLARRRGTPFIAEGIGPGPFPRRPSEWVARRLVRMAERISVRTASDARNRLVKDLAPEIGRDPAFDYLATRGSNPSRLREQDRRWIERLLEGAAGRAVIGLNLRPIRHLFTVGVPAMKRATHTRLVEARFEERLAAGLRRFHQACPAPPCFVFFPMNAVQFGMSDLRSAYRLARLLRGDVDLRVWEADASLDGVVALLRRLDVVIAMRFHAAIFALAQERRVIGIDYRVGARDKVGALLEDMGQGDSCRRIDEMTADWLVERLLASTSRDPRTPERRPPAVLS